MKVIQRTSDTALVELGGLKRTVSLALLDDAEPGDYLIIHAGFAIQKLDEEEAIRTMKLLEEFGNASG